MKNLLFNLKNLFKFINVIFIIVYIYPGSLLGCIFYGNCEKQPQISPDYIVSSNHVYIFSFVSIIGFFAYLEVREMKLVFWYLIFISIFELVESIPINNLAKVPELPKFNVEFFFASNEPNPFP